MSIGSRFGDVFVKRGKRRKYKHIYKKLSKDEILDLVREWISKNVYGDWFFKEQVAADLQLKECEIEQALKQKGGKQ